MATMRRSTETLIRSARQRPVLTGGLKVLIPFCVSIYSGARIHMRSRAAGTAD